MSICFVKERLKLARRYLETQNDEVEASNCHEDRGIR